MTPYDPQNVFARILRGEIPCEKVFENTFALGFHDIGKRAPVHILLIPKGPYTCATDFYQNAPPELIVGFSRAIAEVTSHLGVLEKGARFIVNQGLHGGQEVPHFHLHILGGKNLGPMIMGDQ